MLPAALSHTLCVCVCFTAREYENTRLRFYWLPDANFGQSKSPRFFALFTMLCCTILLREHSSGNSILNCYISPI